MKNEKPIYKNTLPIQFYFFRGLLLGGLIFLLFLQYDYRGIIAYTIIAFLLSRNQNNYIIQVYDDKFNIILPSIYGRFFEDKHTYYYKDISAFKFTKGFYDIKAAFWGEIIRLIFPASLFGIFFAYQKPTITFSQKEKEEIEIKLSYNQNSLLKAVERIEESITLTSTYHKNRK